MEDNRIVDLYWHRNESAINETATKYGTYLHSISYHILSNEEDAEECVNDTYNDAWQSTLERSKIYSANDGTHIGFDLAQNGMILSH